MESEASERTLLPSRTTSISRGMARAMRRRRSVSAVALGFPAFGAPAKVTHACSPELTREYSQGRRAGLPCQFSDGFST